MIDEVKNVNSMRCLGVFLIVLSIAEVGHVSLHLIFLICFQFAVGGVAWTAITNVRLGAWWAGVTTFATGIIAMYSYAHWSVVTGCVFSILGLIIAVVGAIVDGIAAGVFNRETACGSTKTGQMWGSSGGKNDVAICALGYAQSGTGHNAIFDDQNFFSANDDFHWKYDCVCTDDTFCYEYNLGTAHNCGDILTTYTYLLCVSTALCVILSVTCLVYSIFACVSCCCNHHPKPHPPVHEMHATGGHHYYSKTHNYA